MSTKEKQKLGDDSPEPNLIFVGLSAGREPVKSFVDGADRVTLPADQVIEEKVGDKIVLVAKPFYHAEAARVVRVLGTRLYKFYNGEKTPADDR